MQVLHMLDSLNRGGAEMLALDLCRNARAGGLDLTFVATGGGALAADFQTAGPEFIQLDRRAPFDPRLVVQLRRIVRARNAAIVHCHQAVEALHAYAATRGTPAQVVLSHHLCTADAKNRRVLRWLVPRVAANVAVSHDLRACLQTHAGFDTSRNFHVVHNGVDAARLRATRRGLRAELHLPAAALLLGMVGNFYADGRKDQLTVCHALPQFLAAVPQAHFVFVGGPEPGAPQRYDECVAYCAAQGLGARVHFLGRRADVPAVLAALDVFVFSTRADSFGLAVVEAMLTGLPVVVSDIPALLEVTDAGAHAVVFRTGDAADLTAKLYALSKEPQRRAQLGAAARAWAAAQFGIAAHISSLRRLYSNLAARA